MQYRRAIFDLDGTILNTLEDLAAAGNHALSVCGMPQRTVDEVRQFVGNGIRRYLSLAVPEGTTEEVLDRVHASFTEYYAVHCSDRTAPYPGIPALLQAVRRAGMRTAVVSNKPDYGVQTLCSQYFPGLFDAAAGERDGVRRKPAPDAVNAVLESLQIPREEAVYIGDSDVDIETARNAGMPCISVCWGFRSVEFLQEHGASVIVDNAAALERLLLD